MTQQLLLQCRSSNSSVRPAWRTPSAVTLVTHLTSISDPEAEEHVGQEA